MTRAERRRQGREQSRRPAVYQMTDQQITGMKQEAAEEAAKRAFLLLLGIPILVLKDHFGQLIRKECEGKTREQRFFDFCVEMYRSFEEGYFGMEDLMVTLKEECGIETVEFK